jgi:hypothetical protein
MYHDEVDGDAGVDYVDGCEMMCMLIKMMGMPVRMICIMMKIMGMLERIM